MERGVGPLRVTVPATAMRSSKESDRAVATATVPGAPLGVGCQSTKQSCRPAQYLRWLNDCGARRGGGYEHLWVVERLQLAR